MKVLFSPALVLALLLLVAGRALATPLDDRISEFKHAVEKEAAAKVNGPNGQAFAVQGMNPAAIGAAIDQMLAQMDNPSYGGNLEQQLAQMTSMFTSEEVQEATTNLLNEIHKERKAQNDAEVAALKDLIAHAGPLITQAKKPEDLDDLITEMGKHEGNRYGNGNPVLQGNQELSQQFSSTYEFTKEYQNYLAHMATGQTDQARGDLQTLTQNNYGISLIPRSKLLELTAPDKMTKPAVANTPAASTPVTQAQAILDGMKTLDDMEPALEKLAPLRQSNMGELQYACSNLEQMVQTYQSLKVGLPAQINLNGGYGGNGPSVPAGIRAQLLLLAMKNRFDSYKGKPPEPTEKPVDFVDRVIADALSREDWDLLQSAVAQRRFLEQQLGLGMGVAYTGGLESLIAAAHQEEAGQFTLAVQSYELALKSSDSAIPSKIIGDKLAAIQRDHPKEYADGMQLVVSPPGPSYYRRLVLGADGRPTVMPVTNAPTGFPPTLLSPATSTNAPSASPK